MLKFCSSEPGSSARLQKYRFLWLACLIFGVAGFFAPATAQAGTTNYVLTGVLQDIKLDEHQLVIAHEEIPHLMDAMTMPFNVKDPAIFAHLIIGEKITCKLHVTETESWVDHIEHLNNAAAAGSRPQALLKQELQPHAKGASATAKHSRNPLRDYEFTNELGQPVSLSDFHGQAIALTFFFTRCPVPEFCPRLSRNFQEAQHKLEAMKNAPTNWHLISVSFDPVHDTPEVLRAYAKAHEYDPQHWSFLTGPKDKIAELARLCDVKFDPENGGFNHNFRTLIIDASNHLQMVFPTSGDLSDSIVQELLKAACITNGVNISANSRVISVSKK